MVVLVHAKGVQAAATGLFVAFEQEASVKSV